MSGVRSFWWVAGSLVVVAVGAFGPWAQRFGLTVDGSDDEFVGLFATLAALALLIFAVTRNRRLASVPLLAGLVSAMWIGHDLQDPAGPFGGPGPNIHLEWGIWLALAGSIALMVASAFLIAEATRGTVRGSRRAGRRRAAVSTGDRWLVGRRRRRARELERRARLRFLAQAAQFTQIVSVESEGLLFLTSTDERSDFFAKRTRKELHVLKKALAILESAECELARTTFVDAGAYIGTTTLAALEAGFSRVLACEPEPGNARLLRANIALNGAEAAVRVCEVALSNEAGTATLDVGRSGRSRSSLLPGSQDEVRSEMVEVTTARLDDLALDGVFDPAEVGLFWLDVEGYEYRILEGATIVLERSPPLVMELYPRLLRRAGGIASLPGVLARHYTHVADLRSSDARLKPVKHVSELIESYDSSKTDLLFCRRSASLCRRG